MADKERKSGFADVAAVKAKNAAISAEFNASEEKKKRMAKAFADQSDADPVREPERYRAKFEQAMRGFNTPTEDILVELRQATKVGAGITASIAGAMALPVLPLIGGALAMTLADQAGTINDTNPEPQSITGNALGIKNRAADAALEVGENVVGGKVLGTLGKVAKGLGAGAAQEIKGLGAPVVREGLLGLKPTVAQSLEGGPVQNAIKPIATFIENNFAPRLKALAAQNSAGLAKTQIEEFIKDSTGRKVTLGELSNATGRDVTEITEAYGKSVKISQDEWAKARRLAEGPKNNVLTGTYDQLVGRNPDGTEVFEKFSYAVPGGTPAVRSGMASQEFLNNVKMGALGIDGSHPMVRLAADIAENSVRGAKPVPFSKAVAWTDAIEKIIQNSKGDVEVKAIPEFIKILNGLEKDLRNGVKAFKVNAPEAQAALENALGTTRQRIQLFTPGLDASRISQLQMRNLDTSGAIIQEADDKIRTQILDPYLRKRALVRGTMQLDQPLVNGRARTSHVTSDTSMRRDMGAFLLKDIMEKSMEVPALNAATGNKLFNSQKAAELVRDPHVASALKDLLSTEQMGEFTAFLKNLESINHIQAQQARNAIAVKYGSSVGIALTGGAAGYLLGDNPRQRLIYGGAGASIGFSGMALAKIFTKPWAARILNQIVSGKPLNRSALAAFRILREALVGSKVTVYPGEGRPSIDAYVTKSGLQEIDEKEK
jgi:hypothetical protein